MYRLQSLVLSIGMALGSVGGGMTAQAVQLADGSVYFNRPPSLLGASTTVNRVTASNAVYYFDLDVPSNAGEPLQTVTITQQSGNSFFRQVEFQADATQVFTGTRRRLGEEVAIASSTWDEETRTLTITLADPIEPGTEVSFRLEPERNPRGDGVYLFGVTAYPAGEQPQGQFLGYGRLHFYENGEPFPLGIRK